MPFDINLNRRQFSTGLAVAAAASLLPTTAKAASEVNDKQKFCAFIKFLRDFDYERLAEEVAQAGFDGVEVTAREKEGYIHPAKASDELPKLQDALAKRNLEITILTTDILGVDQPYTRPLLETAAALKIPRYRLGFFRYDLSRPIIGQLSELKPVFKDIAAMNREIGIAGVYQNHCGPDFFSATVWDLHDMIADIPPSEIGCVFDIRHAEVEAGEAWPQLYNIMQPHIIAISVKDYVWDDNKSKHAPLGKGRLNRKFFEMVKGSDFRGPISVHVEYLPQGSAEENMQALKQDFQTLKEMMSA